jgi:rubrerythrin
MTVLTPTHDTGARTKVLPMVSVPPGRALDDDALAADLPDTGKNMPFIADVMSAALAHERCGRHLYRSVAGRTVNPMLRSKYEHFGEETERHVEILSGLISSMGGDPQYVSPMARATEGADSKLLEATFMLSGSVDVMTAEMVMLDAVLLAETIDHANWVAIEAVARELPDGELKSSLLNGIDEVLRDEDDHLGWARETRLRMITLQAKNRTITSAVGKLEEMTARVKNLFD